MQKAVLNSLIQKLKKEGYTSFDIIPGAVDLDKFNEASGSIESRDFMSSYILVTQVQVQGLFNVTNFTASKKFLELKSEYSYTDYSHKFRVEQSGTYYNVYSNFPSIHRGKLTIYYDLTTFIESTSTNILKGSVQYLQIIPKK